MHGTIAPAGVRPPLKWAGGKRWQLPEIRSIWKSHEHRRLVEPFCGGLAITLGLLPAKALLNDSNPHVISFYRWLKKGLAIDLRMENEEKAYYLARERFNNLLKMGRLKSREAAELFYYLNRTGYNGLCRFNQQGEFNVPFGRYRSITYATDFSQYKNVFATWDLTNQDFERIEILADDFVYADPPYDVDFTQYSKGGFPWEDQERTARWLARHSGPVVLVNQATPRVEKLYQGLRYRVRFLQAPRRISCTGDRTPAREIIATRNL